MARVNPDLGKSASKYVSEQSKTSQRPRLQQQMILLSEVGYLMFTLCQVVLVIFFILTLFINIDNKNNDLIIKFISIICYGILTPLVIVIFTIIDLLSNREHGSSHRGRLDRRINKTR